MANKQQFDLVLLSVGYKRYAVPKAAALYFMDLCAGSDIYEWDNHWTGGDSEEHAKLVEHSQMPTVALLGPVQFHQALENRKQFVEAEKVRKAAKAAKDA